MARSTGALISNQFFCCRITRPQNRGRGGTYFKFWPWWGNQGLAVVNSICLPLVSDFLAVNVSSARVCLGLASGILRLSYDYRVANLTPGLSPTFLVLYFILEGKIPLKHCEGARMSSIKYLISSRLAVRLLAAKVWSVWRGSRGLRFCISNGTVGRECSRLNSSFLYEISDTIGQDAVTVRNFHAKGDHLYKKNSTHRHGFPMGLLYPLYCSMWTVTNFRLSFVLHGKSIDGDKVNCLFER